MKTEPTMESLWTVEQVAEYLSVSRALVYRLPLRFTKIASMRRYDPADVRLYVANNINLPRSA